MTVQPYQPPPRSYTQDYLLYTHGEKTFSYIPTSGIPNPLNSYLMYVAPLEGGWQDRWKVCGLNATDGQSSVFVISASPSTELGKACQCASILQKDMLDSAILTATLLRAHRQEVAWIQSKAMTEESKRSTAAHEKRMEEYEVARQKRAEEYEVARQKRAEEWNRYNEGCIQHFAAVRQREEDVERRNRALRERETVLAHNRWVHMQSLAFRPFAILKEATLGSSSSQEPPAGLLPVPPMPPEIDPLPPFPEQPAWFSSPPDAETKSSSSSFASEEKEEKEERRPSMQARFISFFMGPPIASHKSSQEPSPPSFSSSSEEPLAKAEEKVVSPSHSEEKKEPALEKEEKLPTPELPKITLSTLPSHIQVFRNLDFPGQRVIMSREGATQKQTTVSVTAFMQSSQFGLPLGCARLLELEKTQQGLTQPLTQAIQVIAQFLEDNHIFFQSPMREETVPLTELHSIHQLNPADQNLLRLFRHLGLPWTLDLNTQNRLEEEWVAMETPRPPFAEGL